MSDEKNNSLSSSSEPLSHRLYQSIIDTGLSRCTSTLFHVKLRDRVSSVFIKNLQTNEEKKLFQCNSCIQFMDKYGSLAIMDKFGKLTPLFWDSTQILLPRIYYPSIMAIQTLFDNASVTSVYHPTSKNTNIGYKILGGFHHMNFIFPSNVICLVSKSHELSVQHNMLMRVVNDNNLEVVGQAYALLKENKLWQSEKHIAPMKMLIDLLHRLESSKNHIIQENMIWFVVGTISWEGSIASLRNGILSTLLESIRQGKSFDEIDTEWRSKTAPDVYLRPQALPTQGNVNHAEKLFASLGITANDLKRSYLKPSQIPNLAYLWKPEENKDEKILSGLFGHLVNKPPNATRIKSLIGPASRMSFSSFVTNVLPHTTKAEYGLERKIQPYFFITGNEGTKPLMQWHDTTNLASWYVRNISNDVTDYCLKISWNDVSRLISFPHMWHDDSRDISQWSKSKPRYGHQGQRYLVCFKEIQDTRSGKGMSLFPEMMRSEFHSVRSTIEAFSKDGYINKEVGQEYVGGIEIHNRSSVNYPIHHFRITNKEGRVSLYDITSFE